MVDKFASLFHCTTAPSTICFRSNSVVGPSWSCFLFLAFWPLSPLLCFITVFDVVVVVVIVVVVFMCNCDVSQMRYCNV